jgi:hypothetical protein
VILTSHEGSKFDDFVIQPEPLEHHELSEVTRNKIMTWLNKNSNITVNYSLPEGGSVPSCIGSAENGISG